MRISSVLSLAASSADDPRLDDCTTSTGAEDATSCCGCFATGASRLTFAVGISSGGGTEGVAATVVDAAMSCGFGLDLDDDDVLPLLLPRAEDVVKVFLLPVGSAAAEPTLHEALPLMMGVSAARRSGGGAS